ncbi:MAG: sortase [Patescibacteria group bacterium]
MKKQRLKNDRMVYSAIALMNLFVVGMFITILYPEPAPIVREPVATVVRKKMPEPALAKIQLGLPTRIVVSSVGIDLPVQMGSYDPSTQTWTVDTQSAFYADRTVPVNDSNGSTLIYGHAQYGLFSRVPEIREGATAEVYTDTGKVFSYTFQSSREVTPDDTSIFVNTGPPMLILQTCSGPYDVYRTLVSFYLSGVSS